MSEREIKTYEYIFKLRTASALFMHGADNKNRAELRPPSIKGVMRFWFRALAGSMVDVPALWNLEGKIFGSTEAGQGVCVRVQTDSNPLEINPWPYLLPYKQDVPNNQKVPRPAIRDGENFAPVHLFERQSPSDLLDLFLPPFSPILKTLIR